MAPITVALPHPINKPSTLFLGEILGASGCLPKLMPPKKAKVSVQITINNNQTNVDHPY